MFFNGKKYLFISIVICFSSLIVDGYFQYFFGKNLFGYALYNDYRVSSFFGSELILGSYLARFFPIVDFPTPIMPVKTRFLLNLISDFEFDFS